MSTVLRQWDPANLYVIVGGAIMTGFAAGSFVTVARNEQAYTFQPNADGGGTRSKSNNFSGTITIRLAQSSPANAILSGLAQLDEKGNQGAVPVLIKDGNGKSIYSAQQAWIQKIADSEFAVESGEREWVLETHHLEAYVGGN